MEQLFMIFPERMRKAFLRAELSIERLQEIRLRVGRPVLLQLWRDRVWADKGRASDGFR